MIAVGMLGKEIDQPLPVAGDDRIEEHERPNPSPGLGSGPRNDHSRIAVSHQDDIAEIVLIQQFYDVFDMTGQPGRRRRFRRPLAHPLERRGKGDVTIALEPRRSTPSHAHAPR